MNTQAIGPNVNAAEHAKYIHELGKQVMTAYRQAYDKRIPFEFDCTHCPEAADLVKTLQQTQREAYALEKALFNMVDEGNALRDQLLKQTDEAFKWADNYAEQCRIEREAIVSKFGCTSKLADKIYSKSKIGNVSTGIGKSFGFSGKKLLGTILKLIRKIR